MKVRLRKVLSRSARAAYLQGELVQHCLMKKMKSLKLDANILLPVAGSLLLLLLLK